MSKKTEIKQKTNVTSKKSSKVSKIPKEDKESAKTTKAKGTKLNDGKCCTCASFTNHPGRCSVSGEYKARKADGCKKYRYR